MVQSFSMSYRYFNFYNEIKPVEKVLSMSSFILISFIPKYRYSKFDILSKKTLRFDKFYESETVEKISRVNFLIVKKH